MARRTLFAGLSAWSAHGGIQRFNRRVADALIAIDPGRRVLMLGDGAAEISAAGGAASGAAGSKPRFYARFARMAAGTDLLLLGHINLLPLALPYRLFRPHGRVILFAHGIEVWGGGRYRRSRPWESAALRRLVDQVWVVSRYTQGLMARSFALPEDRFRLFPNAVSVGFEAARTGDRSPTLLTVSRLGAGEAEKHVDKLVRAMPAVLARLPEARLQIVGDGPLRAGLEALAVDLGVAAAVDFLGFVSDAELDAAYARATAFALPSSKEGFGIVFLEAWLRGLPVLASRFGAAPEVVSDTEDGFTVNPEEDGQVAGRIITLLTDRDLAARFAAAGRAKVERLYSDDIFRANLKNLVAALE